MFTPPVDLISTVTCCFSNFILCSFLCAVLVIVPHPLKHCNSLDMITNPPTLWVFIVIFKPCIIHELCLVTVSAINYTAFSLRFFPFYLHFPPLPLCSSEGRWNHRMMILSVSAPVPVSHPFGASVLGGPCPRARQDLWVFLETRCHGTCPSTRGGSGRVRTLSLIRQRGPWFVLQVRR